MNNQLLILAAGCAQYNSNQGDNLMNIKRLFPDIYQGLPQTDQELDNLIVVLLSVHGNSHKELLNHLQDVLTIIDNKANALLTHNSLWIALLAIFASSNSLGFDKKSYYQNMIILFLFVVTAASSYLVLKTVFVRWSTIPELQNASENARVLLKAREERTISYRWAHTLSTIGLILAVTFMSVLIIISTFF